MNDEEQSYLPGSLLWSKIGNHPYWPCMVSYDPFSGLYFKEKKARGSVRKIYHVQFFGRSVEHGWTSSSKIFPFNGNGIHSFYSRAKMMINLAPGALARKNVQLQFNVPEGQKYKSWELAIEEALEANTIENLEERFQSFVFMYEYSTAKKSKNKNGLSNIVNAENRIEEINGQINSKSSNDSNEPPLKKQKLNEVENYESNIKAKKIKKKKISIEEDFVDICKICEKDGVEFSCSGICLQSYHVECMGLYSVPSDFKCIDCSEGKTVCFACKNSDGIISKCKSLKCQKFYHDKCLIRYGCTKTYGHSTKICGFHSCLTCNKENAENIMSFKGPFLKCFRCPTAFHDRDSCIAAGSIYLNDTTIICPDHFLGNQKSSSLINLSKCVICNDGGELICCETCPQAYHASCLDNPVPIEDFYCEDCTNRRPLSYGMIVLGKTGKYRFWPAMIVYPEDVPQNIENLNHNDGEFVIKYFGTNEYAWSHKGRLLLYSEEFRETSKIYGKSKLATNFQKSLEEAFIAYEQYQNDRSSLNDKPEAYKHIRVNKPIPPATILNVIPDTVACDCRDEENPCSTMQCLNRSTNTECIPNTCSAINECLNQRFQKKIYPKLKVIKTVGRGWGLAAQQPIKKGDFIIEYVGEVITTEEYERRSADMLKRKKRNFYFLYLDSKRMIDAGPSGNLSRFINHSCDPNCELQKWNVVGDSRVGVFAVSDIQEGEELSFNYDLESFDFKENCLCNAETCQRYLCNKSKVNKL